MLYDVVNQVSITDPTQEQIYLVVRSNIEYLEREFPGCVVFGSAALVLEGFNHVPNDYDIYINDLMIPNIKKHHIKYVRQLVFGCQYRGIVLQFINISTVSDKVGYVNALTTITSDNCQIYRDILESRCIKKFSDSLDNVLHRCNDINILKRYFKQGKSQKVDAIKFLLLGLSDGGFYSLALQYILMCNVNWSYLYKECEGGLSDQQIDIIRDYIKVLYPSIDIEFSRGKVLPLYNIIIASQYCMTGGDFGDYSIFEFMDMPQDTVTTITYDGIIKSLELLKRKYNVKI